MRRDYFICVFLLLVATSLAFVCLLPTCFSYQMIIPREISIAETIVSLVFSFLAVLAVPLILAYKRKLWATLGMAAYGFLAYVPGIFIPKLAPTLSGADASLVSSIKAFLLEDIYIMVNAPFVGISKIFGNNFSTSLSKAILPSALIFYALIKLIRFYKEAYAAELLAPTPAPSFGKSGHSEEKKAKPRKPDILGTVISAPVNEPNKTGFRQPEQPKTAPVREQPKAPDAVKVKAPQEKKAVSSQQQSAPKIDQPQQPRPNVRTPNINIPESVKESPKQDVIQLGASYSQNKNEANNVINLGPPPSSNPK